MSHASNRQTLLTALGLAAILAGGAAAQTTTRISLNGTVQSNQRAFTPQISGNGRVAAFSMGLDATGGALQHVWVYAAGAATDITPNPGTHAFHPRLSHDGLWVAYESPNPLTSHPHLTGANKIYLENIASGAIELITVGPTGNAVHGEFAALSHALRYVAFQNTEGGLTSPTVPPGILQVYVRDRTTGTNSLVSRSPGGAAGNAASGQPDISADGRWIVFESSATNLVPGVTAQAQIYVCDRTTGAIRLLSRDSSGQPGNNGSFGPSISDNGRYVTYNTAASNLAPGGLSGNFEAIVLDRDDDGNGIFDDSPAHNIGVSVDSLGNRLRGSWSSAPRISGDGRWVLMRSIQPLVQNATPWLHVYLHDLSTHQTTCVSVDSSCNFGNNMSGYHPLYGGGLAIDEDGNTAVFVSSATNLVNGDTNGQDDIFLHEVPRNPTRALGSPLLGFNGLAPNFTVWQGGTLDFHLRLRDARPGAFAVLGVSSQQGATPLFGGTVIPAFPLVALGPVFPNANGAIDITANLTPGPSLFLQWGVLDPAAVQGVALSNALELIIQP